MNKEYILLSIIIIGTLTIVGMFIHINARFGMRKAFLELINRKSFLAITVIIINTVISYSMIHFNELDKLSQPNQSQSIQKDKEEEQNKNQQNGGGGIPGENTTTETTMKVGGTIIGTEVAFKQWLSGKNGYEFIKFANGVGTCKNPSGVTEYYYWDNNQWNFY